jgi:hypothetical protein
MNLIPWVLTLREEGSLDYDGGFVRLQIHVNFATTINHQQAPFSGAVAGEQGIKIRSSIAFLWEYFSVFLLIFRLHLLTLIILKKEIKSI